MSDTGQIIISEVSHPEQSRKAHAKILQAMQKNGTGVALAEAMKTSNTKISRIKNEVLADALELIYHLGFKVVESDSIVIDRAELKVLRASYAKLHGLD
jgi:Ni,Fe-hydrogenase III component G